jgi:rod shape-determining protein MreC
MENLIARYRNVTILVAILFAQVLGLAVQVKRPTENESSRLIRIWTVSAVAPFEKAIVWLQGGTSSLWHDYFYLRGVRQENRKLKEEIERLRMEQVRLNEDAEQARRLQALLGFKEQFVAKTVAAQVIGSSGSEQSRSILIDKGARDGIQQDMPVITADGVVGKVLRVFNNSTSQVLLINDQSSGVGAILEKSRLQGVLRGTPAGEVLLEKVMSDEQVQPGERVLTSGGDQIFPKGLPVGTVSQVSKGSDFFLSIRIKPATNLSKLEEVLVITKKEERAPAMAESSPGRAADILAQRLPSVPDKAPEKPIKPGVATGPKATKPQVLGTVGSKQPGNGHAPVAGQAGAISAPPAKAAVTPSKPATTAPHTSVPIAGPVVTPATAEKPAPPPVRVSEKTTDAPASESKPAVPQPKPQPPQPQAEPGSPEDKPH